MTNTPNHDIAAVGDSGLASADLILRLMLRGKLHLLEAVRAFTLSVRSMDHLYFKTTASSNQIGKDKCFTNGSGGVSDGTPEVFDKQAYEK